MTMLAAHPDQSVTVAAGATPTTAARRAGMFTEARVADHLDVARRELLFLPLGRAPSPFERRLVWSWREAEEHVTLALALARPRARRRARFAALALLPLLRAGARGHVQVDGAEHEAARLAERLAGYLESQAFGARRRRFLRAEAADLAA